MAAVDRQADAERDGREGNDYSVVLTYTRAQSEGETLSRLLAAFDSAYTTTASANVDDAASRHPLRPASHDVDGARLGLRTYQQRPRRHRNLHDKAVNDGDRDYEQG
ncbi:hypothetical protein EYR40_002983 [Pleurotus pulmonarius]|nr:hypothetical protein EYR40_002983 [Pleurotus pulmonarius]